MKISRVSLYFFFVVFFFFFNFYFRPIKGNSFVTAEYRKSSSYINDLYKSDEYFKKNLLSPEQYPVYDKIVEASLANDSVVSIHCENCSDAFMKSYYAIYLDHPELISFLGINGYREENGVLTYHNYKNLGKLKTYFGTRRIAREMENIRRDVKNMNEKEKILYVYKYVASHNYDRLFTYTGSNQSAYSFFTKSESVCAGFAKASQLIFQNIGISSYLVLSEEHMWNYVEYDGKYYVFDATVGASYTDKKYKRFYDGLGRTTIGESKGLFSELYPQIEEKVTLKELFQV